MISQQENQRSAERKHVGLGHEARDVDGLSLYELLPLTKDGVAQPEESLKLRLLLSLLADVPTELLADPDESAVDVAGSLSHAGCGR